MAIILTALTKNNHLIQYLQKRNDGEYSLSKKESNIFR